MILLLEVLFQIIKQMSEEVESTLKIMINSILIRHDYATGDGP
jgi:hypothetical protein